MDLEHRLAIKANAQQLKNIDKNKLRPFIEKSKLFTRSMLKDIFEYEEAYLIEELPTRGPNAFNMFLKVLKDAGEYEAAENLEKSVGRMQISNSPNINIKPPYYKMAPSTIGYCLIVNNVDFNGQLKARHWSDEDALALHNVFEKIGFDVEVKNNLNEDVMYSALQEIAGKGDLDSCVVIILSYGDIKDNHKIIYGCDEKFLYVYEIILKLFGSRKSELYGKPKLFFLPTTNTKVHDTDSASVDGLGNVPYKDVFIHYFPSEKINGKSYIKEFSQILLDNYKTEDLASILRMAMNSSFNTYSEYNGLNAGIHFNQDL